MAELTPEIQKTLTAKARRRKENAAKSFPEKIRMLVALQKMLAPIERKRGRDVHVWDLPG